MLCVSVFHRQDLELSSVRAAEAPLYQNSREAPVGLEMQDSDAYIDLGHSSGEDWDRAGLGGGHFSGDG